MWFSGNGDFERFILLDSKKVAILKDFYYLSLLEVRGWDTVRLPALWRGVISVYSSECEDKNLIFGRFRQLLQCEENTVHAVRSKKNGDSERFRQLKAVYPPCSVNSEQ